MMTVSDALRAGRLFFDGGMGSLLQASGLPEHYLPDVWSIENPEAVIKIHQAYLAAGSQILTTNTFGSTAAKLAPYGYTPEAIMSAAAANIREAARRSGRPVYIAADLGPTGRLLKPYGDLDFEEAVGHFSRLAKAAEAAGCDLIIIETMSDLYEMKAAVIGAKEGSALPIFATLAFAENGKLFTGGDAAGAVALLEGLGVAALGVNCGFGPRKLGEVIKEMAAFSSLPLICQPNAGLPKTIGGSTVYDLQPADFAADMQQIAAYAQVLGGCCGTTPAHIRALTEAVRDLPCPSLQTKDRLLVSSYCRTVEIGPKPVIIGERINPTGKKKLQRALREHNLSYVLREALEQEEAGAAILDLNVGLPDIDEPQMLVAAMEAVQSVSGLPLQLDTADPLAMERALRRYNGKPLINSVNGKAESLAAVLPLVQKYGGALICLTLDDNGIPETAAGRLAVAAKIIAAAEACGIPRRELIIDALTMPVSAGDDNAQVTLETVRLLKEKMAVKTALGVSNVSFGLPQRGILNTAFFTLALYNGLDAAIINPKSAEMMGAYYAYCTLSGQDPQSQDYIAALQDTKAPSAATPAAARPSLGDCVRKGLQEEAVAAAKDLTRAGRDVLAIINDELVPALDDVGRGFEQGSIFLPQLLMSAEAAKAAFEVLKLQIKPEASAADEEADGPVLLATVKGDIHDIGKNIVKVLLESHRFKVLDLGKDVAPETIVRAVKEQSVKLVGLSALMTTTAPYMAKTISLLREEGLPCRVVVGGAVITQDYADLIQADHYSADAMDTVRYAEEVFRPQSLS